jgi:hypothetical protein
MPAFVHRFSAQDAHHEHTVFSDKHPAQALLTAWVHPELVVEQFESALRDLREYVETCYSEKSANVLHYPPLSEQGRAALKLPLIVRFRPHTSRSLALESVRFLAKKIRERYLRKAEAV